MRSPSRQQLKIYCRLYWWVVDWWVWFSELFWSWCLRLASARLGLKFEPRGRGSLLFGWSVATNLDVYGHMFGLLPRFVKLFCDLN